MKLLSFTAVLVISCYAATTVAYTLNRNERSRAKRSVSINDWINSRPISNLLRRSAPQIHESYLAPTQQGTTELHHAQGAPNPPSTIRDPFIIEYPSKFIVAANPILSYEINPQDMYSNIIYNTESISSDSNTFLRLIDQLHTEISQDPSDSYDISPAPRNDEPRLEVNEETNPGEHHTTPVPENVIESDDIVPIDSIDVEDVDLRDLATETSAASATEEAVPTATEVEPAQNLVASPQPISIDDVEDLVEDLQEVMNLRAQVLESPQTGNGEQTSVGSTVIESRNLPSFNVGLASSEKISIEVDDIGAALPLADINLNSGGQAPASISNIAGAVEPSPVHQDMMNLMTFSPSPPARVLEMMRKTAGSPAVMPVLSQPAAEQSAVPQEPISPNNEAIAPSSASVGSSQPTPAIIPLDLDDDDINMLMATIQSSAGTTPSSTATESPSSAAQSTTTIIPIDIDNLDINMLMAAIQSSVRINGESTTPSSAASAPSNIQITDAKTGNPMQILILAPTDTNNLADTSSGLSSSNGAQLPSASLPLENTDLRNNNEISPLAPISNTQPISMAPLPIEEIDIEDIGIENLNAVLSQANPIQNALDAPVQTNNGQGRPLSTADAGVVMLSLTPLNRDTQVHQGRPLANTVSSQSANLAAAPQSISTHETFSAPKSHSIHEFSNGFQQQNSLPFSNVVPFASAETLQDLVESGAVGGVGRPLPAPNAVLSNPKSSAAFHPSEASFHGRPLRQAPTSQRNNVLSLRPVRHFKLF